MVRGYTWHVNSEVLMYSDRIVLFVCKWLDKTDFTHDQKCMLRRANTEIYFFKVVTSGQIGNLIFD